MRAKLYDAENWAKLEAGQDGIELIKLIDQLIRSQANRAKEQNQVAGTVKREETEHMAKRNECNTGVSIKQAGHQDKILLLAIKIAGIYQQVVAVPVDQDDPPTEIIQDFVVGFTAMGTNEMAMVV